MNKRALFLTHLYFPAVGGAERGFRQLAEGLVQRGWKVTLLTSDALSTEHFFTHIQTNLKKREFIGGVEVIRESIETPVYRYFKIFDRLAKKIGRFGVFYRPITFGPHFYREFINLIKEHFPLIIAGPVPTSTCFYALLYRYFCPATKVVILPCMHIKDKLHKSWLNLVALRLADFVLPLSEAEKKYLLARGLREEKVGQFFLSVEDAILGAKVKNNGKKNYVLYLGQEGEHKRIPILLKAMAQLWKKGEKVQLIIAGARTGYSWTIDRLIKELPAEWKPFVHRFNDITEEEKVSLLDNCLVMINPSGYESFGMVFLEAWARKKPVIGAAIPAVREIIEDGVDGFLFEDNNEKDLERKIRLILEKRDLAEEMGIRGYNKVRSFYTQEKLMDKLEFYINQIMQK